MRRYSVAMDYSGTDFTYRRQEFDEDADAIIVNDGSLVDSQDWLSVPAPHLLSQEAYVTQNNLAVLAKKLDQVMKVVLWLQRNEA